MKLISLLLLIMLMCAGLAQGSTLTITNGATCTVTSTAASSTITCSEVLTPVPPPVVVPPVVVPPVAGCPARAVSVYNLGPESQRQAITTAGTAIAAIKFVPVRGTRAIGKTSLSMPLPGYKMPDGAGVEVNFSECPGDFARTSPRCGFYSDGSLYIDMNWSAAPTPATWQCKLNPAKVYYLNIRFVNPNTGITTCTAPAGASCGIYSDWYIN